MSIGEDFAKIAQEKYNQEKARNQFFNNSTIANKPLTDDEEIQEFIYKRKNADYDYFK